MVTLPNEWIESIRPLFPKRAQIEVHHSAAQVVLQIDWKLGNDPARPHKRSRLIRVIISEGVMQQCRDFKLAGSGFKQTIERNLSFFCPDHETCLCGVRPKEIWSISAHDID